MNSTVVREIRETKINPKSSFENLGAQNTRENTVYKSSHSESV
jgi:hypothetical protein